MRLVSAMNSILLIVRFTLFDRLIHQILLNRTRPTDNIDLFDVGMILEDEFDFPFFRKRRGYPGEVVWQLDLIVAPLGQSIPKKTTGTSPNMSCPYCFMNCSACLY